MKKVFVKLIIAICSLLYFGTSFCSSSDPTHLMHELNSKPYVDLYSKPYLKKIVELSNYFIGTEFGFIRRQVNINDFNEKIETLIHNDDFHYDLKNLDCVTYIETVIALALSAQLDGKFSKENFEKHLQAIRYKNSKSTFFARNHITELDWLKDNKWLVKDKTKSLFKKYGIKQTKTFIDKLNWVYVTQNLDRYIHKQSNKYYTEQDFKNLLQKHKIHLEQETSTLTYIPTREFLAHYDAIKKKLPLVSIVNIIRPHIDLYKAIGTNLNITHQGFLIKKDDKLFIRHASATFPGKVVDIEFDKYLEDFKNDDSIKGVNIWILKKF